MNPDLVSYLPGLNISLNFKHYSGYLTGMKNHQLHYWFIESVKNSRSDPLVVWLNGGPGCSSLDGLFAEHGPFYFRQDLSIGLRSTSWNQITNIIYLESPIGVGFSHGSSDIDPNLDDDIVADDNYAAIKSFYQKFPKYRSRALYLMGESYAGVYLPTLALRIMKDKSIKLEGLAIGNGLLDTNINYNSIIYYARYHGLLDQSLWSRLRKFCCKANDDQCIFFESQNAKCSRIADNAYKRLFTPGLNIYNINKDCKHNSFHRIPLHTAMRTIVRDHVNYAVPPCINSNHITTYLNLPQVRRAIHITNHKGTDWTLCNMTLRRSYESLYLSTLKLYQQLLPQYRLLIYNGDADMVCNFIGAQWAIESLNLSISNPSTPWRINTSNGRQVAGFVTEYNNNVYFTTVKGAGHMVPESQPQAAFKMMKNFLEKKRPQEW